MEEYLYQKRYNLKTNGAVVLLNPENALRYVGEKIESLLKEKNINKKLEIKLQIVREFKKIYNYDLEHSIFNFKTTEEVIKYEILKQNFILYLGNIYSNYHTILLEEKKEEIPMLRFPKFIIDYNELYDEALTDYFRVLKNISYQDLFGFKKRRANSKIQDLFPKSDKMIVLEEYRGTLLPYAVTIPEELQPKIDEKSYLASYILPSLIDNLLSLKINSYYIKLGMKKIKERNIKLSDEENELVNFINSNQVCLMNGKESVFLSRINDMLVKYNVFQGNKEIHTFIKDKSKITIGKILNEKSKETRKLFVEEYLYLLDTLFVNFNLRNNTMHLNDVNDNYFSICYCSIMFELLWGIYDNSIFKKEYLEV